MDVIKSFKLNEQEIKDLIAAVNFMIYHSKNKESDRIQRLQGMLKDFLANSKEHEDEKDF
ncbi:hypothetical protein Q7A53_00745 [Halobacillus rhizosphaerae]|uniref:hypothetical protein n=1 Tax=Halobacillus rhizosphaerae TaxID=3064889 RepID=UPI00398A9164